MLKKLIKYEFNATGRSMLPMYLALLVLSIINKIFWVLGGVNNFIIVDSFWGFISAVSTFLYILVFIVAMVITLIVIIQRFYKNLLRDEGYLMKTLPVTAAMNITAKLITAIIWLVICGVIAAVSILILAYSKDLLREVVNDFSQAWKAVVDSFGAGIYFVLFEGIIFMIIMSVMSILKIYLSIIIGHLANNHKILLSFAAYIVINFVLNIIGSSGILALGNIYGNAATSMGDFQIVIICMILYFLILSVIFFAVSSYIMNNKLNLE